MRRSIFVSINKSFTISILTVQCATKRTRARKIVFFVVAKIVMRGYEGAVPCFYLGTVLHENLQHYLSPIARNQTFKGTSRGNTSYIAALEQHLFYSSDTQYYYDSSVRPNPYGELQIDVMFWLTSVSKVVSFYLVKY